jgi:hypothetical protein
MTITAFDRKTLQMVQEECLAAMHAIAERHGLTVRAHGGQIDPCESVLKFAFKTQASVEDPTMTTEGKTWAFAAPAEGIAADAIGKWFTDGRDEYRAMGWNYNAPKRPIKVQSKRTGKQMIANIAWFKALRPVAASA